MNTTIFKLLPCLAWAALAISSASPASARILTSDYADYATCSASWGYSNQALWCDSGAYFQSDYVQHIRMVTTGCSAGGCGGDGQVYTEFTYGTGRKTASYLGDSCGGMNVYGLDSCAC
jgi:hypothetical protein